MTATSDSTVMAIFAVTVLLYLPDFADRSCVGPFVSICRNQRFQADETLVSSRGNFSFKLKKLWFQADETLVPSGRNILFQRLELILELYFPNNG